MRMPRKRPAIGSELSGERGIARVAADFVTSCAGQAAGLTVGQRALIARIALDLASEVRLHGGARRVERPDRGKRLQEP
jgi:hypothetical protein